VELAGEIGKEEHRPVTPHTMRTLAMGKNTTRSMPVVSNFLCPLRSADTDGDNAFRISRMQRS
jgi:hypothetical protein